jgi:hypothetical protein
MLNVFILNVFIVECQFFNVMPSIVILGVSMFSVVMLSIVILGVVMFSVAMLSVVAPFR